MIPFRFESKDSELQWERATARNALLFKEKVESGEYLPEAVMEKLEKKVNRTKEEEDLLRRRKEMDLRREKVNSNAN